MQVTAQRLSPVLLEVDVQVEVERVRTEIDKAYGQVRKTAKIPGFRPGKAPRKVLVHAFGPRINADVAQRLVDETYESAIGQQGVQAVSQPAIEPGELKPDEPFSYKARVEIIPEIKEVNYDQLEVTKSKAEVSDDLVDVELTRLRRENATVEPVKEDRGAAKGDILIIDFKVQAGDEVIEDAGAEGFQAELGSGGLLPAIETALTGKKAGESGEAEVEFPKDHPHPKLKGQTAKFLLSLKELKERVLPDLDDEFAKDLGEYDSLDAFKVELKERLTKQLEEQAENKMAEELVQQLVKANPIDVPPSLVQRQSQVTEREVMQQAQRAGQGGQQLPPQVRENITKDSETKVRAGLLMAEIAKKEGIKIGDAEIEEGLKELSEQTGKNIAKVRAEYGSPQRREMLVGMILENKVLDIIQSKAKISES